MRLKVAAGLLSLMALIASPALTKPVLINGQVNHDRINSLTSKVSWNRSLGQAESQAASQGKMVFWVHMLGTMEGAT